MTSVCTWTHDCSELHDPLKSIGCPESLQQKGDTMGHVGARLIVNLLT
jgi:hypothetical protein